MNRLRLMLACAVLAALPAHAQQADPSASPSPSPSPSPAPPSHVLVTGQAFNHMGAGVADAEVSLKLGSGEHTFGPVKTNEIGDFQITAPEAHTGPATVTIRKQHFQDITFEVVLAPDNAPFVDVSMIGAIALAGTVTSRRESKPVVGAEVVLEVGYDQRNATTDDQGSFKFENLPPGGVRVAVKAVGFAHLRQEIGAVESAGAQSLVLDPERIAHIHVTDAAEKPIAGASVECVDEQAHDYRHLITDERGAVVVRGLRFAAAELAVRLAHERYVSSTDFDRTINLPADAEVSTHGLIMQAAGVVVGVITDAGTRQPLNGARMSAGRVLSDSQPRAFSDFEGAYRMTGVTPGRTPITVHLAGYAPQLIEPQVVAGEEVTLNFALGPARVITGQVVDGEQKPMGAVHVRATRWAGNDTLGLQAMTDEAGQFVISDAPRDAFEISLYARGFKPLLDQTIKPEQEKFAFALAADPRSAPGMEGAGPAVGSAAPAFSVTTLDGRKLALADLAGKVVLLDFWATWCGPCVGEIPNLVAAHAAFGKRADFVMLSISIEDDAAKVKTFTAAKQMNWLHAAGADSGAVAASEGYAVSAIPALYLIDRDGKIAARDLRGAGMVDAVGKVLGPNAP